MEKLHLCDNMNYLSKDFESYCSTALVPNKVIVMQLGRLDFFIFHPINLTLTIDCPSGKQEIKHTFRGTHKFEIYEGCIGYSKAYLLISSNDITVNFTMVQMVSKWKVRQL
jgi:hypothetical protein